MMLPPFMPRLKICRFPCEIVAHSVWTHNSFALSTADVQDLPAERGAIVCPKPANPFLTGLIAQFEQPRVLITDKGAAILNRSHAWAQVLMIGPTRDITIESKEAKDRRRDERNSWVLPRHKGRRSGAEPHVTETP